MNELLAQTELAAAPKERAPTCRHCVRASEDARVEHAAGPKLVDHKHAEVEAHNATQRHEAFSWKEGVGKAARMQGMCT